jgi:hypothetical protein
MIVGDRGRRSPRMSDGDADRPASPLNDGHPTEGRRAGPYRSGAGGDVDEIAS